MEFNRRGFLIAAVGGSLIALGGEAFARAPDRYKRLIDLQRDLFNANEAYKAKIIEIAGPRPEWPSSDLPFALRQPLMNAYTLHGNREREARKLLTDDRIALSVQANHLLRWTMENFNGQPTDGTRQQIRDLFNGVLKIDTLSEADLRSVEDPTINCAVARTMLSKWKMPIDTQKMDDFTTFAERYRALILA